MGSPQHEPKCSIYWLGAGQTRYGRGGVDWGTWACLWRSRHRPEWPFRRGGRSGPRQLSAAFQEGRVWESTPRDLDKRELAVGWRAGRFSVRQFVCVNADGGRHSCRDSANSRKENLSEAKSCRKYAIAPLAQFPVHPASVVLPAGGAASFRSPPCRDCAFRRWQAPAPGSRPRRSSLWPHRWSRRSTAPRSAKCRVRH